MVKIRYKKVRLVFSSPKVDDLASETLVESLTICSNVWVLTILKYGYRQIFIHTFFDIKLRLNYNKLFYNLHRFFLNVKNIQLLSFRNTLVTFFVFSNYGFV